jgi:hypothetical protein
MSPKIAQACPFCGVVSETPHETQESCIAVLQAEIARTRALLGQAGAFTPLPEESHPDGPSPRPNR